MQLPNQRQGREQGREQKPSHQDSWKRLARLLRRVLRTFRLQIARLLDLALAGGPHRELIVSLAENCFAWKSKPIWEMGVFFSGRSKMVGCPFGWLLKPPRKRYPPKKTDPIHDQRD